MESLTLDDVGRFVWDFYRYFHIETSKGNFEWSDPEYGGDNTIRPCGSYEQWLTDRNISYGRYKGQHIIRNYCGNQVRILE